MTRLIHICLLLAALSLLTVQSAAMAVAPMNTGSSQTSITGTDCVTMAKAPGSEKLPCKKMTLQCMAAMGCVSLALVEPGNAGFDQPSTDIVKAPLSAAARLLDRSYAPEPDPPSFLI